MYEERDSYRGATLVKKPMCEISILEYTHADPAAVWSPRRRD